MVTTIWLFALYELLSTMATAFKFLCLSSKLKKKKCVDIKNQLDGIPRKRRNKYFTNQYDTILFY